MSIAVDVVTPWPVSTRGSANDAVPFLCTVTVIMSAVGLVASVNRSLRSWMSARPGADGIGCMSVPASSPGLASAQRAAATTVGPATTYVRNRRRVTVMPESSRIHGSAARQVAPDDFNPLGRRVQAHALLASSYPSEVEHDRQDARSVRGGVQRRNISRCSGRRPEVDGARRVD